jgi:hypothetical protein
MRMQMEIVALNDWEHACSTLDIGYRMLHVYYLVFGAHRLSRFTVRSILRSVGAALSQVSKRVSHVPVFYSRLTSAHKFQDHSDKSYSFHHT